MFSFVLDTRTWRRQKRFLSPSCEVIKKQARIFLFSWVLLSLINNQNLVSLKNPRSIEFNTSILVLSSFQFILINIQKNQRTAKTYFRLSILRCCFFFRGGKKKKQSKSYYRQRERREEKYKILFGSHGTKFFRKIKIAVRLCSRFTHSSYPLWRQQVHEANTKKAKQQNQSH